MKRYSLTSLRAGSLTPACLTTTCCILLTGTWPTHPAGLCPNQQVQDTAPVFIPFWRGKQACHDIWVMEFKKNCWTDYDGSTLDKTATFISTVSHDTYASGKWGMKQNDCLILKEDKTAWLIKRIYFLYEEVSSTFACNYLQSLGKAQKIWQRDTHHWKACSLVAVDILFNFIQLNVFLHTTRTNTKQDENAFRLTGSYSGCVYNAVKWCVQSQLLKSWDSV